MLPQQKPCQHGRDRTNRQKCVLQALQAGFLRRSQQLESAGVSEVTSEFIPVTMRFFSSLLASILGTFVALGLLLLLGSALAAALLSTSSTTPTVRHNSVLVVELSGPVPEIASHDPLAGLLLDEASYDLQDLRKALRNAAADDRIGGMWLKLRGVQASWSTLEEIRLALEVFKASGKPMFASSGEYMMAERDYFLATVADSIFALPEAFFEFNGMYLEVMFLKGLLDKLDIEPEIIRVGEYKGAVESYSRTDLSRENEIQLQSVLDEYNGRLIEAVAASRAMDPEDVRELATDGAMITAAGAFEAGLLDGLLYEDEVTDLLRDRTGQDGDLRSVRLTSYMRVPDAEATGERARTDDRIAIVYAVGTILTGTSPSGISVVGSATFRDAMEKAREDERVKAVVLRINSPGGSAVASDAMWREIELTAREKPVVASMGDVAASGGYWIATAADTIVADRASVTGSIGVFGMLFNVGTALESNLGITTDGVQTSPYADMFSALRSLRPEERAILEQAIASTYDRFLERVSEARGMETAAVDSIGKGRVWTGRQAMEVGLVDALGGMDTAIELAAEMAGLQAWQTRLLPRPRTLMEEISDLMIMRVRRTFALPAAERIEELIRLNGQPQARVPLDFQLR